MPTPCTLCDGSGLRVVERPDGTRVAQECACRLERRANRVLTQARIPQRYAHCTLDDYVSNYPGANSSLGGALQQARNFVRNYPFETDGKGLLFVGRPGLGKTHLSVGILRALIAERGAKGLFVDYRDLLKQVQASYDPASSTTELGILRPVFDAEVLVLDDLGASKPTDWVFDTVAHLLNSRYNDRLTTIITTNFSFASETRVEELARKSDAQRLMTERTLGDRIGDRVLSRLNEMCVTVRVEGNDFREGVARARFA